MHFSMQMAKLADKFYKFPNHFIGSRTNLGENQSGLCPLWCWAMQYVSLEVSSVWLRASYLSSLSLTVLVFKWGHYFTGVPFVFHDISPMKHLGGDLAHSRIDPVGLQVSRVLWESSVCVCVFPSWAICFRISVSYLVLWQISADWHWQISFLLLYLSWHPSLCT